MDEDIINLFNKKLFCDLSNRPIVDINYFLNCSMAIFHFYQDGRKSNRSLLKIEMGLLVVNTLIKQHLTHLKDNTINIVHNIRSDCAAERAALVLSTDAQRHVQVIPMTVKSVYRPETKDYELCPVNNEFENKNNIFFQGIMSELEKVEDAQDKINEYKALCALHIKRLAKYSSKIARDKKTVLEEAQRLLEVSGIENFRLFISKNQKKLIKPHSSIPKNILKGLIVFLGLVLGIVPGVLLAIRFFSKSRPTTTGTEIVDKVIKDKQPNRSKYKA